MGYSDPVDTESNDSPSERPAPSRLSERIRLVVTSLRPADTSTLDALAETDKRYAERPEPGPSVGVDAAAPRGKGPRGGGAS